MNKIKIEICCGSAADVIEAKRNGADRVELNTCLYLGGLTPSSGELSVAKKNNIEIIAMVRPREGGFCYTDTEFETCLSDARYLLDHGADGIAFGFLNSDGTIDEARCKQMMSIIGNRQSVFHRAFDVVPDWHKAMDILCSLGVTRILTSGQHVTAVNGIETIKKMVQFAGNRIEILPASGINADNVDLIIRATGCTQIHAGLRKPSFDHSSSENPKIHFADVSRLSEGQYSMTDGNKVKELIKAVDGIV